MGNLVHTEDAKLVTCLEGIFTKNNLDVLHREENKAVRAGANAHLTSPQ
jgi:hypothetical protein